MRISNTAQTLIAGSNALAFALGLLFLACSTPGGPGGTAGANDNSGGRANENTTDLGEAQLTLPDSGRTLLVVEEEVGIGSVTYSADRDVASADAEVAEFVAQTGDEPFTVSFNEVGQPLQARMGTMELTFTTHPDGTVDYQVRDQGERIWAGSGIIVDEALGKGLIPAAGKVSSETIADCALHVPREMAEDAPGSLSGWHCVERNPDIIRACTMLCVMKDVMLLRLGDTTRLCEPLCRGRILDADCMRECTARMERASRRVLEYYFYLYYVTEEMAAQIADHYAQHRRCPGEEDNANDNGGDDNANANANLNANENDNTPGPDNGNDNDSVGGHLEITGANYPTAVTSDGDKGDLIVSWSGDPVFPVEVVCRPTPDSCPPGLSCSSVEMTFADDENPLVFPDAVWCYGLSGTTLFAYEVVLVDARGVESAPYPTPFTCQGD